MPERIVSRSNPLIKRIRALAASAESRREQGQFLCDSPKLLEEALRWSGDVRTVVCTNPSALPLLPEGVDCVTVSEDVMTAVSPAKTPQGVLCLCALPDTAPPARLDGRRYVVLDGVQDPGNVGTVLRTADAFGADGLFLLPGCADPFSSKTVRASMGAVFRRPVWQCGPEELKVLLDRSAIGSEGRGLSQKVLALCDATVRIPMEMRCESLNAAIAAAVLLWEAYR